MSDGATENIQISPTKGLTFLTLELNRAREGGEQTNLIKLFQLIQSIHTSLQPGGPKRILIPEGLQLAINGTSVTSESAEQLELVQNISKAEEISANSSRARQVVQQQRGKIYLDDAAWITHHTIYWLQRFHQVNTLSSEYEQSEKLTSDFQQEVTPQLFHEFKKVVDAVYAVLEQLQSKDDQGLRPINHNIRYLEQAIEIGAQYAWEQYLDELSLDFLETEYPADRVNFRDTAHSVPDVRSVLNALYTAILNDRTLINSLSDELQQQLTSFGGSRGVVFSRAGEVTDEELRGTSGETERIAEFRKLLVAVFTYQEEKVDQITSDDDESDDDSGEGDEEELERQSFQGLKTLNELQQKFFTDLQNLIVSQLTTTAINQSSQQLSPQQQRRLSEIATQFAEQQFAQNQQLYNQITQLFAEFLGTDDLPQTEDGYEVSPTAEALISEYIDRAAELFVTTTQQQFLNNPEVQQLASAAQPTTQPSQEEREQQPPLSAVTPSRQLLDQLASIKTSSANQQQQFTQDFNSLFNTSLSREDLLVLAELMHKQRSLVPTEILTPELIDQFWMNSREWYLEQKRLGLDSNTLLAQISDYDGFYLHFMQNYPQLYRQLQQKNDSNFSSVDKDLAAALGKAVSDLDQLDRDQAKILASFATTYSDDPEKSVEELSTAALAVYFGISNPSDLSEDQVYLLKKVVISYTKQQRFTRWEKAVPTSGIMSADNAAGALNTPPSVERYKAASLKFGDALDLALAGDEELFQSENQDPSVAETATRIKRQNLLLFLNNLSQEGRQRVVSENNLPADWGQAQSAQQLFSLISSADDTTIQGSNYAQLLSFVGENPEEMVLNTLGEGSGESHLELISYALKAHKILSDDTLSEDEKQEMVEEVAIRAMVGLAIAAAAPEAIPVLMVLKEYGVDVEGEIVTWIIEHRQTDNKLNILYQIRQQRKRRALLKKILNFLKIALLFLITTAIGAVVGALAGLIATGGSLLGALGGGVLGAGIQHAAGQMGTMFSNAASWAKGVFQSGASTVGQVAGNVGSAVSSAVSTIGGPIATIGLGGGVAFTAFTFHTTGAFLMPSGTTLSPSGEYSKYVTLTKESSVGTNVSNAPNEIGYQVTIVADKGYNITITDSKDITNISFNESTGKDGESRTRAIDELEGLDSGTTIAAGESVTISYINKFGSAYQDSRITNVFSIDFEYENGDETGSTSARTSLPICVGDCPTGEGCWPATGELTQGPHGAPRKWGNTHASIQAIDIHGPRMTPVYTPYTGTMCAYPTNSGWLCGANSKSLFGTQYCYGNHVVVDAGSFVLGFAHLDSFADNISVGANSCSTVTAGTLIGYMGNSGLNYAGDNGVHVHYELRPSTLDFRNYLPGPIELGDVVSECAQ